jgi:hypothetical protein
MENNIMILSEQTVSKEYQIPELVDLKSVSEAMGSQCKNGTNDAGSCFSGTVGPS